MVSVSLKGIKRAEPSFAAASEGDEPAGRRASLCGLSSLLPPLRCGVASAGSTRWRRTSASVTVGCRFALEPPIAQLPCMPCVINPPMLPGKHSTFSEYKQFLCISLQPFFIFKTYIPLFLICGNAKRKSERVAPAGMWSAVASLSSLQ